MQYASNTNRLVPDIPYTLSLYITTYTINAKLSGITLAKIHIGYSINISATNFSSIRYVIIGIYEH